MKALIALQFWEGDRNAAMRLAKYLADLERTHTDFADFLLVNRFDCRPIERADAALSRKFNLYHWRTRSRVEGWPAGCNAMWVSTIEWVKSMCYGNGRNSKVRPYDFIFTCEADGAPIRRDWIAALRMSWLAANKAKPVTIAGPLVGVPGTHTLPHINGNCLVSGAQDDLDWLLKTVPTIHPNVGWDYGVRDELEKRGWANTPDIQSYYNTPMFSREQYEQMISDNLTWVHGDKSGCLVDYGRERFNI